MRKNKTPEYTLRAIRKYNHSPRGKVKRKEYILRNRERIREYNKRYLAERRKRLKEEKKCEKKEYS